MKDIWALELKWSDHDRFRKDYDRKLAEVSSDYFFSFSCAAHKHSRQRSYKNYGKQGKLQELMEKPEKLCGGESVLYFRTFVLIMFW